MSAYRDNAEQSLRRPENEFLRVNIPKAVVMAAVVTVTVASTTT